MQHSLSANRAPLLESLNFSQPPSSSYVVQRRQTSSLPTGAGPYEYEGSRVCRVQIASSDEWLDPSSVSIQLKIRNPASYDQSFKVPDAASFITRMKIIAAGQVVEDIQHYNRVHNMFRRLSPSEVNHMTGSTSFDFKNLYMYNDLEDHGSFVLQANTTWTVSFKPLLSGLLNANRYIPLRWCPLCIELTFAPPVEVMYTPQTEAYEITAVSIKHDCVMLDTAVQNQLSRAILEGEGLTIAYPQLHTIFSIFGPASTSKTYTSVKVAIQRAFTRLSAAFVTFGKTSGTAVYKSLYPRDEFLTALENRADDTARGLPINDSMAISWQWQLGGRKYPEAPVDSVTESFDILTKAVNAHAQSLKGFNLGGRAYVEEQFILGQNFQRTIGQPFSGTSTRGGETLTLSLDKVDLQKVQCCWVTLVADAILEIADRAVTFID